MTDAEFAIFTADISYPLGDALGKAIIASWSKERICQFLDDICKKYPHLLQKVDQGYIFLVDNAMITP